MNFVQCTFKHWLRLRAGRVSRLRRTPGELHAHQLGRHWRISREDAMGKVKHEVGGNVNIGKVLDNSIEGPNSD